MTIPIALTAADLLYILLLGGLAIGFLAWLGSMLVEAWPLVLTVVAVAGFMWLLIQTGILSGWG